MSLPLEEAYVGDAVRKLSWPRLGLMAAGASVVAAIVAVVIDVLVSLFGLIWNLDLLATVLGGYGFVTGLVVFILEMCVITLLVLAVAATEEYDPSLDFGRR